MTTIFPEPRAVYFHVPFCRHRCGYCDFTLVAGRDDLIERYLSAVEIELGHVDGQPEVDTCFLGGGTPSHLSPEQLVRLSKLIRSHFRLADGYEFTIEANPLDLDPQKIDVLRDIGVNRVSLGIQSFDSEVLSLLERDHLAKDVFRVIEQLQTCFDNISFDLIFGVPGQSLDLWKQTLHQTIELAPRHISTYGLTFEKGTSFWMRRKQGDLNEVVDETGRAMYAAAMDLLAEAGFEHYELSNFAQPGFESRHNTVYWNGLPYYAFGPGAARYINGCRETNHRSVTTWLKRVESGQSAIADSECLSDEDRAREAIILGLRRCRGIDKNDFQTQTGFAIDELAEGTISKYQKSGLLEDDGLTVRLTREGRFLADTVFVDFL